MSSFIDACDTFFAPCSSFGNPTEEADEVPDSSSEVPSPDSSSSSPSAADKDVAGVAASSSSSLFDALSSKLTVYAEGASSRSQVSLLPMYDVFLSFRGADTRRSFVSHLYRALTRNGINTFKDDRDLERGKFIEPAIHDAIRQSRFSVVVLSKDYASSSWCLDELQAIVHRCMQKDGNQETTHCLLPVFYGVEPGDVSDIQNSYAESFAKHQKDFPDLKVRNWKAALKAAAESSGWGSSNKDEVILIEEIVAVILKKLGRQISNKPSGLVGMELRKKELERRLDTGSVDVRMVGIWGMPGIGKTTIAEAVYHDISQKFDACCFLRTKSVREDVDKDAGLNLVRKKLISDLTEDGSMSLDEQRLDGLMKHIFRKRCVLIVLDGVSNVDELPSLAGDHEWFGSGTRIIITTDNMQLLERPEVDDIYEAKPLNGDESLQLFRQHAFSKKGGQDLTVESSTRVVKYCQGIPLALKVLGCSLFNMDSSEMESRLKTLEEVPPGDIIDVLRLSFDVLDSYLKVIFLDIACFFNGEEEDYVVSILESSDCPALYGLGVLQRRCLISKLEDGTNRVWMHDLMQQMGRQVVREESPTNVGMRSRLWLAPEIFHLLAENMGTGNVEAIVLNLSDAKPSTPLRVEAFHSMRQLRLLKICSTAHQSGSLEYLVRKEPCPGTTDHNWRSANHDSSLQGSEPHFLGNLNTLSNQLRVLHWYDCPLKNFPANFYPCNLVELNLSYNRLKSLWTGKEVFDSLKFMKLSYSHELTQTPDFGSTKNLEILILEGCAKLVQVHPSVGSLEKLTCLNLKDCIRLQKLPKSMGMRSLQILILSGCSKVKKLPEMEQNMGSLTELLLDGTGISRLPASIANLTGLVEFSIQHCKRLQFIPEEVGSCRSLKTLRLKGCSKLRLLNFYLDRLENLEELHADGTRLWLKCMMVDPRSNMKLSKLRELTFGGNRSPFSLADFFRDNLFESEPARKSLKDMFWFGNRDLSCRTSKFAGLTKLDLSNSRLKELPLELKDLDCLLMLDVSGNPITSVGKLPGKLEVLCLANCCNLSSLPSLPSTTYLVDASNCKSLTNVDPPQGIASGKTRSLDFTNCNQLGQDIAFELLRVDVLKMHQSSVDKMSIIVPGCQMPSKWLLDRNLKTATCCDPSTRVSAPLSRDNTAVRGLCAWVVF